MACNKHLHWTQRLALIQHNLHAASRTGNFNFFSNIQSAHFLHGTDYVAHLNSSLGDDADKLISVLDNFNSGIAWAHEDAFKAIYEGLNDTAIASSASNTPPSDRNKALLDRLHADIAQQRASADATIDKLMTQAVAQIQLQPFDIQEDAAMAFMLGTTFIADAVQVSLEQLNLLERYSHDGDLTRVESAYALVRFAVSAAVSALKGVLNMMELHDDPAGNAHARRSSIASISSVTGTAWSRSRATSEGSDSSANGQVVQPNNHGAWNFVRRVSTAFGSGPPSRRASLASTPSSTSSMTSGSPSNVPGHTHGPGPHSFTQATTYNNGNVTSAPPPAPSTSLKSPPGSHKRGMSLPYRNVHVLSPIQGTPAPDEAGGYKNPFEANFAQSAFPPPLVSTPEGNEGAWSLNQSQRVGDVSIPRSLNPSPTTVDKGGKGSEGSVHDPSSRKTSTITVEFNPVTTDDAEGAPLVAPNPVSPSAQATFVDAQSSFPAPVDTPSSRRGSNGPGNVDVSSPPAANSETAVLDAHNNAQRGLYAPGIGAAMARHGRRRSTEIREMPPELHSIRMAGLEAGVSM